MARHRGEADRATAGLGRVVGPQVPGHTPSRSLVRPSPGLYTASVATALAIATTSVDTPTTPVTSQATTETRVVGTAPTEETTATSTTPTTTETAQAETTSEPAPAIEQFARDNFYRLTVVGVGGAGTLEIAQDFVGLQGHSVRNALERVPRRLGVLRHGQHLGLHAPRSVRQPPDRTQAV